MLKLIRPTIKHQESYRQALTTVKDGSVPGYIHALKDIPADIKQRRTAKDYATFWLMDGREYIGSIGIEMEVLADMGRKMHWYIERPVADLQKVEQRLVTLGMKELAKMFLVEHLPRSGTMRASPAV